MTMIRVEKINGKTYLIAEDYCQVINYRNKRKAVAELRQCIEALVGKEQ